MTEKICKNCKHYNTSRDDLAACGRPRELKVDLVTGEKKLTGVRSEFFTDALSCQEERYSKSLEYDYCGAEGKFFVDARKR